MGSDSFPKLIVEPSTLPLTYDRLESMSKISRTQNIILYSDEKPENKNSFDLKELSNRLNNVYKQVIPIDDKSYTVFDNGVLIYDNNYANNDNNKNMFSAMEKRERRKLLEATLACASHVCPLNGRVFSAMDDDTHDDRTIEELRDLEKPDNLSIRLFDVETIIKDPIATILVIVQEKEKISRLLTLNEMFWYWYYVYRIYQESSPATSNDNRSQNQFAVYSLESWIIDIALEIVAIFEYRLTSKHSNIELKKATVFVYKRLLFEIMCEMIIPFSNMLTDYIDSGAIFERLKQLIDEPEQMNGALCFVHGVSDDQRYLYIEESDTIIKQQIGKFVLQHENNDLKSDAKSILHLHFNLTVSKGNPILYLSTFQDYEVGLTLFDGITWPNSHTKTTIMTYCQSKDLQSVRQLLPSLSNITILLNSKKKKKYPSLLYIAFDNGAKITRIFGLFSSLTLQKLTKRPEILMAHNEVIPEGDVVDIYFDTNNYMRLRCSNEYRIECEQNAEDLKYYVRLVVLAPSPIKTSILIIQPNGTDYNKSVYLNRTCDGFICKRSNEVFSKFTISDITNVEVQNVQLGNVTYLDLISSGNSLSEKVIASHKIAIESIPESRYR